MTLTSVSTDLDRIQSSYKGAVEEWITAIRKEEALASVIHSEAAMDTWDAATSAEEEARAKAKSAKKGYEDALRLKFFKF